MSPRLMRPRRGAALLAINGSLATDEFCCQKECPDPNPYYYGAHALPPWQSMAIPGMYISLQYYGTPSPNRGATEAPVIYFDNIDFTSPPCAQTFAAFAQMAFVQGEWKAFLVISGPSGMAMASKALAVGGDGLPLAGPVGLWGTVSITANNNCFAASEWWPTVVVVR